MVDSERKPIFGISKQNSFYSHRNGGFDDDVDGTYKKYTNLACISEMKRTLQKMEKHELFGNISRHPFTVYRLFI